MTTAEAERFLDATATFSEDRLYRYTLSRTWSANAAAKCVGWILLNPSTADADVLDPTLRRCVAFSKSEGAGAMYIGNVFALRSTDPKALVGHPDPVGYGNVDILRAMAAECSTVIVGWGSSYPKPMREHVADIARQLHAVTNLWCLGTTKAGDPRHPLYLAADTELRRWRPEEMHP